MKKIFLYVILCSILTGCSIEDNLQINISQNEVNFSAKKGEQILNINSNFDWECYYDAEWLLVRQQQDRIKIVVDANNQAESRIAYINFLYEGDVKAEIVVLQDGIDLTIDKTNLSISSKGGTESILISCNTDWSIENLIEDWCTVIKEENSIAISATRNYQMQERSGTISIKAGDIEQIIVINQSACQWFETFEMIEVEGGSFYMGGQNESTGMTNFDIEAYQIESPVHKVSLNKFAICKYEVTQLQWKAAMKDNPSTFQDDKLPVETITWDQVQEFISILNTASGLNYRLPTEAEWEFAAKGGNKSQGFKYSGFAVIGACAWYYSNSESTTHEVGTKNPNELGIYDMTGNVREWCNDWFDYYTSSNKNNPQGPVYGSTKINRGGSWTTPSVNCRNSYRNTNSVYEASYDLGFRLALSLE